MRRTARAAAALLCLAVLSSPAGGQAARRCPAGDAAAVDALVARGWQAYRTGDVGAADSLFATALRRCPGDVGALTGRAYAHLRRGDLTAAAVRFDELLALRPRDYESLTGRGMIAYRRAEHATARRLFERALTAVPGDSLSRWYLARLPDVPDSTRLRPLARPSEAVAGPRTRDRRFEVPDGRGGWRPLWVKAVNLGAALPGRHPSEFPADDGTYESWIALMAGMNANTIRLYTVHPPHFYRALERWNQAHPSAPLWLLHGVWTELPPGTREERYDDRRWNEAFRREMRDVVDLLHGRAAIEPRPGHAAGTYTADVSGWTLGYIIGREWEPYSVQAFAAKHPDRTSYAGEYVRVARGNAVDAWLGAALDYLVAYEVDRYNAQRPVAYTNWPTLDPLTHPTETSLKEEAALLRARGETLPEPSKEYDNDVVALDALRMTATPKFAAGLFASYHAYPYYPDFMVLDSGYRAARGPEGPSTYLAYLRALVEHHGRMPLVVSEFGVPSSRGNAHAQPQGWSHGGHTETAQAEIDARLLREIHASGAAGAGLFALIDEWFKKNWLVIDFERPLERKRLWHNALDAEEHYGVVAMRPGHRDSAIVVDGDASDWAGRPAWYEGAGGGGASRPDPLRLRSLHLASDEGYLYLRLDVGTIDWKRGRYLIGIDSYRTDLGDRRLPLTGTTSPVGLEFVVDLRGPDDARLLVDSPYNPYRRLPIRGSRPAATQQVYNRPFRTRANADGRYDTLSVSINRRRLGRDGRVFPEVVVERNRLLHADQRHNSLADWYADSAAGTIELRLPWGMLQLVDPSSRRVLQSPANGRGEPGAVTDGFRFVVESYDPAHPAGGADRLPRDVRDGAARAVPTWSWPTWEEPRWYAERKPVYAAMRDAFAAIGGPLPIRDPAP